MQQGWVYVLVNPSMPGLTKVGQTTRLPAERAAELSRATGVATPFLLVYEEAFTDCAAAEHDIHAELDRCGMRYKRNREFFHGPVPDIVRLVSLYARATGENLSNGLLLSGVDLLEQGDRYLFGEGDTLQDLQEALQCYQLAAKRGSVVAYERLGAILSEVRNSARGGRARAMSYLKEGARRGNYYCHCEIATIAAGEGHVANFSKAWAHFFAQRGTAFLPEAEQGKDRYAIALQRYVLTCFMLGITPAHHAELASEAALLTSLLKRALDGARHMPKQRQRLLASLRWIHRTLLHVPYAGDNGMGWLMAQWWLYRWRDAPA